MKKVTMPISLDPDTADFLEQVLTGAEQEIDPSRYINGLLRKDRERQGKSTPSQADTLKGGTMVEAEMMEEHIEHNLPSGG